MQSLRQPLPLFLLLLLLQLLCHSTDAAATAATSPGPCFDTTANVYRANADACSNEAENMDDPDDTSKKLCSTLTGDRFDSVGLTPLQRNEHCEENGVQHLFASRCRKSCKTCCQLAEYGSCADTASPCDRALCNNPAYALSECPATCGKCVEVIRQNKDLELCIDTVADCASFKDQGKCASDPLAAQLCALTCNDPKDNKMCKGFTDTARAKFPSGGAGQPGAPGGPVTGDIGTNCAENKDLCTNPVYREFMQQMCQATCQSASSGSARSGASADCTDKPHTNCVTWKRNGFCDNEFYTEDFRREQCGSTCSLC